MRFQTIRIGLQLQIQVPMAIVLFQVMSEARHEFMVAPLNLPIRMEVLGGSVYPLQSVQIAYLLNNFNMNSDTLSVSKSANTTKVCTAWLNSKEYCGWFYSCWFHSPYCSLQFLISVGDYDYELIAAVSFWSSPSMPIPSSFSGSVYEHRCNFRYCLICAAPCTYGRHCHNFL